MRFGCCLGLTTFLPQRNPPSASSGEDILKCLVSRLEALEENGFDYVEAEAGLLFCREGEGGYRAFQKALRASALKPEVFSAFVPPGLAVVGPGLEQAAIRRFLETTTSRVAESGGRIIVWGSGASRTFPPGFPKEEACAQIDDFLHQAAEYCRKNGILIAIEPMNRSESNTINSLREAMMTARKADRPEIKVMMDVFHLMEEHEPLSVIREAGESLVHVHLSDRKRLCPGRADYPLFAIMQSLKSIRYNHRISLECALHDFARETKEGLMFLREIWKVGGEERK